MEDEDPPLKGPLRRCLATGSIRPKEEMIRFVAGPLSELVPDLAAKLPGRGLWLSPDRDVVHTALTKGLFAKAARRKLTVPPDLAQRLEALMRRRCLDILGMARRAGLVVAGFDQVKEALAKGRALALSTGRGPLYAALQRAMDHGEIPVAVSCCEALQALEDGTWLPATPLAMELTGAWGKARYFPDAR